MSANDFLPIRVSTLRGDAQIPFDAYVHVAGKHILYCRQGDSFEGDRLVRLKSKRLKKMFIRPESERNYLEYMSQNIENAYSQSSGKSIETRAEIIQGAQQAAAEDVMENANSAEFYDVAKLGSKKYVEFILKEDQALKSVIDIQNTDNNVAHHGVTVATLAVGVAEILKVSESRSSQMQTFALGCLIHDIGHQKLEVDWARPSKDRSKDDLKLYQSHAEHGAEHVKVHKHFDELVVKIIGQHEEKINGSGYPNGLTEKDMDELVMIASTVNAYDRMVTVEKIPHKEALKKMLIENMGLYPLDYMKALQDCLKTHKIIN